MTAQQGVTASNLELSGFEPARKLLNIITLTQQHRGMSAGALGGSEVLAAQLGPKRQEVDKAVGELDSIMGGARK